MSEIETTAANAPEFDERLVEIPADVSRDAITVLKAPLKEERGEAFDYLVRQLKTADVKLYRLTPKKDAGEVFYILGLTPDILCLAAERMHLMKKVKDGTIKPFAAENKADYAVSGTGQGGVAPFTSTERILILEHILREIAAGPSPPMPFIQGNNIINASKRAGLILSLYPLHDDAVREELRKGWVEGKGFKQPLDLIRSYFGEEVGFYFAFLGHYTIELVIPAGLGVLAFLNEFINGVDNWFTLIFSLCLAGWATTFLEGWKRKQARLAWSWGVFDDKEQEEERPHFEGKVVEDPATKKSKKVFPSELRSKRLMLTGGGLLLACIGVTLMVFYTLELQTYVDTVYTYENGYVGAWSFLSYLVTIFYVVLSIGLEKGFNMLAEFMTEYENWKTYGQHRDALILKLVVFHFISNFLFLLYYTFYLQDVKLLRSQIIFLLGIRQVIGNVQESLVPYILAKRKEKAIASQHNTTLKEVEKADMSKARGLALKLELEDALDPYEDTFYDYLELLVQFGNITMFAAAFPLAPLLALGNNLMEIRTDALKLVNNCKRPTPTRCSDMGAWLRAFELIGYAAVITNCGIIGLSFSQIDGLLPRKDETTKVIAFVVIEHILMAVKFGIDLLTDDVPSDIREAIEQKEKLRAQLLPEEIERTVEAVRLPPRESVRAEDLNSKRRNLQLPEETIESAAKRSAPATDQEKRIMELENEVMMLRRVVRAADVGDLMAIFKHSMPPSRRG